MKESGRNQQTERRDKAGNWEIREQLEYKGFKVGETTSMKEQRKNWGWVCSKAFRLKRLVLEAPCPERGCKVAVFITFFSATENDSCSNTISKWHQSSNSEMNCWNEPVFVAADGQKKRGWKANKNVKLRRWSETVVVDALKDNRFRIELLYTPLLSVFLEPSTKTDCEKGSYVQ